MRNEKLGKVGKFRDPNTSIEWAVLENLRGGGFFTPPPPRQE